MRRPVNHEHGTPPRRPKAVTETVHYEPQLERKGGSWFLTVTISAMDNCWTSKPAMLDAETEDEAREEAARQIRALRAAMKGEQ